MKAVVIPILILLIATQAFSKWVMVLEYQWNKEYIAQNLCENKAKPKLRCEGKCQLAKRLAAEENDSSSQTPSVKLKFQEIVYVIDNKTLIKFTCGDVSTGSFTTYVFKSYPTPDFPVFHPPA